LQIGTKASAEGSLGGGLGSRSHGTGVRVSRDGSSLIEVLGVRQRWVEERGWEMMVDGGKVKGWEELDGCALR